MTILVTGPETFTTVKGDPEVGRKYSLAPADDATERQNRAFHALVQEYWRSGQHSYNVKTFSEFRDVIKRDLGAGFDRYVYATIVGGKAMIKTALTRSEIPAEVWADPDLKKMVMGRLKSWSDYTKRERSETIDRVISEMHQAGVKTEKFYEILEGMESVE
jgi:hypothetical protein